MSFVGYWISFVGIIKLSREWGFSTLTPTHAKTFSMKDDKEAYQFVRKGGTLGKNEYI